MSIMDQMRKLMKEVESMEIQALRAEFHRLYGDIPHPVIDSAINITCIF